MRCLETQEAAEWLAGTLPASTIAEIEAHVDHCGACRALLADLGRLELSGAAGALVSKGSGPVSSPAEISQDRPLPPEDLLLPGTTIVERYTIARLIGSGGMGIVYQAHDPNLDRWVAVKVVRADLLRSDTAEPIKARLLREARLLAQLPHPNIVVVHDVGVSEGRIFMAMEYVRGCTLRAWLAGPPRRSQREIVQAFLAAGSGLHAAHLAGVVHRDFKPDNVLVGEDGRVRVTDCGPISSRSASPCTRRSAATCRARPRATGESRCRPGSAPCSGAGSASSPRTGSPR